MKKGISLIVLVITIIVMIILAASVVITLSNTGIIDRANQAVQLTDERQVQDLAGLVWAECYLDPVKKADIVNSVKTELASQGVTEDKWNITVTETGVTVTSKANGNEEDEYGYLSGTWKFNEIIVSSKSLTEDVEFTSSYNSQTNFKFTGISTSVWMNQVDLSYRMPDTGEWLIVFTPLGGGIGEENVWDGDQTITFTSKQEVSPEFYDWFVANATKVG